MNFLPKPLQHLICEWALSTDEAVLNTKFIRFGGNITNMVVEHICGFKKEIYCRECGTELIQNSHGQLLCPKCSRRPAILCPSCGKLW